MKVRTLIADDSVVYRSQIKMALEGIPKVEVIGVAANGKIALEKIASYTPDLLVLDLEMPEVDGLKVLETLKKQNSKLKVLVFSSVSKRGAEITMEALRMGASDFITKPGAESTEENMQPSERIRSLMAPKIEALFPEKAIAPTPTNAPPTVETFPSIIWEAFQPRLLVIGSSTGGPNALEKLFSLITDSVDCPIVITQHMPPIFTTAFAERLAKASGIRAFEAKHMMPLERNTIYVAPGDYHLSIQGTLEKPYLALDQGPQIHSVRPAVDPLFQSASQMYKHQCLGVVLTGMGMDGEAGACQIKRNGGAVIIQNEESCVVFGMPRAVFLKNAFDKMENLEGIAKLLCEKIQKNAWPIKAMGA